MPDLAARFVKSCKSWNIQLEQLSSPSLSKDLEEIQEELHDVYVQRNRCKCVVVDLELICTRMLPSDDQLRVVNNVARHEERSTACVQHIQCVESCTCKEKTAKPGKESKQHEAQHSDKEIRTRACEIEFGLTSKKRESHHHATCDAKCHDHRCGSVLHA